MYHCRYGEVVNINLIRDKDTGKQKGYGFLCYEDQRSTILAVDNFNGIKVHFSEQFNIFLAITLSAFILHNFYLISSLIASSISLY